MTQTYVLRASEVGPVISGPLGYVLASLGPGLGFQLVPQSGGGGGGYATIQDEGISLPQQTIFNFIGAGVSVANDVPNGRSNITIPGTTATTFNGRGPGAVLPAVNDYSAQQIFQLDIGAVKVATTGDIVLSGAQTVDGNAALVNGDRIGVWRQVDRSQNGIYDYNTAGAWTRSADQNASNEFRPGVFFDIQGGTQYGGNLMCLLTPNTAASPIIVGTTLLSYGVTSPGPIPGTNDGYQVVPLNGLLTYVNAPAHTARLTAQTASLVAQSLLVAPPSDLYALDVYLEYTAGTGTVLATFTYTDSIGATVAATVALAAVGHQSTRFSVWVASGDVAFTTTVVGTVTYNVTARAARLVSSN